MTRSGLLKKVFYWVSHGKPPTVPTGPAETKPLDDRLSDEDAMRHALPRLVKLNRYESRAAARRDKEIRQITMKNAGSQLSP
jgi:hypothetical protein